jgi:hypothetical protein
VPGLPLPGSLRWPGQAANGDGYNAKDHGGYAQDLARPATTLASTRQTEVVAQATEDDPGKLYGDTVDQEEANQGAQNTENSGH